METLAKSEFGTFSDAEDLRGEPSDFARGSINLMPFGFRQYRPFRGLTAAGLGSRLMFPLRDSYGGLDDVGGQEAAGSLFSSVAETLFYVGNGQVSVEGVNITGAIATSLLRLILKVNGSYTSMSPIVVGLPEPSALTVGVATSTPLFPPITNGTYSFRYARLREATGGKSRASATSNIITLNAQAAYTVVPLASSGQTRHIFFVTTRGLGGVGLHYRIPRTNPYTNSEYTENDVQRTIATLSVTNASAIVTSSTAVFTAGDFGKRFNPISAGFSVPAGTTVFSYDSATQITLSANVTVASGSNPRSAELISYINGLDRAVMLNWRESDLAAEAAEISWIYDFPPPAASHAFQLENRIGVATFADSTSQASSQNAGTAIVFSLPNQLESFDVRYPLYLPEQIVSLMGRGVDSYSFIGTRNGIYAVQFINSPYVPATVSVVLANEGIQKPHNWAISKRALYVASGNGKITRIAENGQEDSAFYEGIRRYIKNWSQASIVICADLKNNGVTFSNGTQTLYYDEQTNRMSTPLYLADTATGTICSAVAARAKMYLSLESGGTRSAFIFDEGVGSNVVGVSPYSSTPEENQMIVQEISARFVADRIDKTVYIGLHRNNLNSYVSDGAITSGTNIFTSASGNFTSEFVGHYILIKGAGAAGAWLLARIKSIDSPSQIRLGTITESLVDSANQSASSTVSTAYALIAYRFFPVKVNRQGTVQVKSPEFFFGGFHSFAASVLIETVGINAQPLGLEIKGTITEEDWAYQIGSWGATAV